MNEQQLIKKLGGQDQYRAFQQWLEYIHEERVRTSNKAHELECLENVRRKEYEYKNQK